MRGRGRPGRAAADRPAPQRRAPTTRAGRWRQRQWERQRPRRQRRALRSARQRYGAYRAGAQRRLRRFRQGSMLAVAITALLLIAWSVPEQETPPADAAAPIGAAPAVVDQADDPAGEAAATDERADDAAPAIEPVDPGESVEQATGTIRDLALGLWGVLPKIIIALVLLVSALVAARAVRWVLRRTIGTWPRADAMSALVQIVIMLIALGAALSVIAGDATALVGSVGLAGLALSWALQTPIESFTGWVLNSVKGHYRVGDRIAVGDVFGDVYRIDVLTTTVWEAGGPGKTVEGAQPTGALVTFPNAEILRATVVNYTRDFPYVWDEVVVNVAQNSDAAYAMDVVRRTAAGVFGDTMDAPAARYRELLQRARLAFEVDPEPQVYLVTPEEAWSTIVVRYLVPARQRRMWASRLNLALAQELGRPEHAQRIVLAYPRMELRLMRGDWRPATEDEGDG